MEVIDINKCCTCCQLKSTFTYFKICKQIVEHNLFNFIILIVIIINSVLIAIQPNISHDQYYNKFSKVEIVFLIIYTMQIILKISAHGIYQLIGLILYRNSYFRDIWNITDFFIAIAGYLQYFQLNPLSLNFIRAIKVIRPLKSINKVKTLKKLLNSLFGSLSFILDTLVILLFMVIISGIFGIKLLIGLVLYNGQFKKFCIDIKTGKNINQNKCGIIYKCPEETICAKMIANPLNDMQNFDTFFWSMINIFQLVTLQGLTQLSFNMQNTFNKYFGFLFYSIVIISGAHIVINLTIAVMKAKFSSTVDELVINKDRVDFNIYKSKKSDKNKFLVIQQKESVQTNASSIFSLEYGSIYFKKNGKIKNQKKKQIKSYISKLKQIQYNLQSIQYTFQPKVILQNYKLIDQIDNSNNTTFIATTLLQKKLNQLVYFSSEEVIGEKKKINVNKKKIEKKKKIKNVYSMKVPIMQKLLKKRSGRRKKKFFPSQCFYSLNKYFIQLTKQWKMQQYQINSQKTHKDPNEQIFEDQQKRENVPNLIQKYQYDIKQNKIKFVFLCKTIVNNSLFEKIVFLVIFINIINLMFQNTYLVDRLCLYFYIFEATIKIIALKFNYFLSIGNIIDFSLIIINFQNVFNFYTLRLFRGFRVLKIIKFSSVLSQMTKIIKVITATIEQFIQLLILIPIFLFVFIILGQQIYKGKDFFLERQNFDSFDSTLILLFQLMTAQNWHIIMSKLLKSNINKILSIIYILVWILWAKYVLLNLFIAMLLQGFSLEFYIQQSSHKRIFKRIKKQQTLNNFNIEQIKEKIIPLNLFSEKNKFRKILLKFLDSKIYKIIITLALLGYATLIIFQTYIKQLGKVPNQIQKLNYITSSIQKFYIIFFILQSIIYIICNGFIYYKQSYLRSFQGIIQFTIIIVGIIWWIIGSNLFKIIYTLIHSFRLLRILKILRYQNLDLILNSLNHSLIGIANITALLLIVMILYSIIGKSLYFNRLQYCVGIQNYSQINQQICKQIGGQWTLYPLNFQNVGNGLISLFVLLTKDNWIQTFNIWSDSSQKYPIKNTSIVMTSLFIISYLLICSYFLIFLFGGMIHMYYSALILSKKNSNLTLQQQNWITLKNLIENMEIKFQYNIKPQNTIRKFFYNLQKQIIYLWLIRILKLVNIAIIASIQAQNQRSELLSVTYYIMTIVFGFQIFSNILAFGILQYINDRILLIIRLEQT